VADELVKALRNEEQWNQNCNCPREPHFHQLYKVLGSKESQNKIWDSSDSRPCYLLYNDPNAHACTILPYDVDDVKAGSICPNNPYHREEKLLTELMDQEVLLERARYLEDLSELHCINSDTMDPIDWQIARIMRRYSKNEYLRTLVKINTIMVKGF
jgi:hypothetical protein